jgi:outer membrane receptor protein involved in Fe transport
LGISVVPISRTFFFFACRRPENNMGMFMHQKSKKVLKCLAVAWVVCLGANAVYAADPAPQAYKIEPQSVSTALKAFAAQSNMQLIFTEADVGSAKTTGVVGTRSPREALSQILKGTGLEFEFTANNVVVVRKLSAATRSALPDPPGDESLTQKEGRKNSSQEFRVAQVDQTGPRPSLAGSDQTPKKDESLTEIVVTGTHIRGPASEASPFQVYTRDDIEMSGAATVAQFVQHLPQNFGGGASESTINGVTGAGTLQNAVSGTGVNLRGIGNSATLVLIDGQRFAPGNVGGEFVDISMIPPSAIERIEVLPDGASAIYGSDAVAGVVNFILRKDFEGVESRASYGAVTAGGLHQWDVSQTAGHHWADGSVLFSYDYFDQTPLSAADRSYTQGVPLPFTLLPEQVRNSALLKLNQEFGSNVQLFGSGTFSHRSTEFDVASPGLQQESPASITAYSGTAGVITDLAADTHLDGSVSYSSSKTDSETTQSVPAPSALIANNRTTYDILTIDSDLNGSLFEIPGGSVKYAVGGQYRHESFTSIDHLAPVNDFRPTRSVGAGFIELRIPLVGASETDPSHPRLELIAADREEHYSDFGSTNNPKVGLAWNVVKGLKVRGTFGTSFEAPLLSQLNPAPQEVFPYPLVDPLGGGQSCQPVGAGTNCTNTLLDLGGGNPSLKPQTARSWTFGVDFAPEFLPGLTTSATYYHIRFRNQIQSAFTAIGEDIPNILNLANSLGPSIVQRNPPQSLVNQLAASPGFVNFFGTDLSTIGAIFYGIDQNLASSRTDGIDADISYSTKLSGNEVAVGVDGTYIMAFDDQYFAAAPIVNILDTPYNPINLRLRGHASLRRGGLTLATYLNYVNSYKDNRPATPVGVASWTTIDATTAFDFDSLGGIWRGFAVQFSATNIANRPPPYVVNGLPAAYAGINYDGANANPEGRFLRLQLAKRF